MTDIDQGGGWLGLELSWWWWWRGRGTQEVVREFKMALIIHGVCVCLTKATVCVSIF